jgi:hypothetical protein
LEILRGVALVPLGTFDELSRQRELCFWPEPSHYPGPREYTHFKNGAKHQLSLARRFDFDGSKANPSPRMISLPSRGVSGISDFR